MSTEFILGGFFVTVIFVFAACMLLTPELMGISKGSEDDQSDSDAESSTADKRGS